MTSFKSTEKDVFLRQLEHESHDFEKVSNEASIEVIKINKCLNFFQTRKSDSSEYHLNFQKVYANIFDE